MDEPHPPIPRRSRLAPEEFLREYLARDEPVIVVDGARGWAALDLWTPEFLRARFGALEVTVQGDTFSELRNERFDAFVDGLPRYEAMRPEEFDVAEPVPYLRYASSLAGADDLNAAALSDLADHWGRPYFLPGSGYLWPLDLRRSEPNRRRYPDFGVYVSPRGALTRLHRDKNGDCAVLCQVYGRKHGFLFAPRQPGPWPDWYPPRAGLPPRTSASVTVLRGERPSYAPLEAREFLLEPGEVLFIPKFWVHEVFTTSASISVTYNFMHLHSVSPRWLLYFLALRAPKIVAVRLALAALAWRRR